MAAAAAPVEARLVLANGQEFVGEAFGAKKSIVGEAVFQTGMVGYPQSLTDPSYRGQILVLTYPLVGNYGVPDADLKDSFGFSKNFESELIHASALIVGSVTDDKGYSHWAAKQSLSAWLEKHGIPAITGIDTRELTKVLREGGCMLGKVLVGDPASAENAALEFVDPNAANMVAEVSLKAPISYNPAGDTDILVLDCGLRVSQLKCLCERGARVRVVPWNHNIAAETFDGLFISSGPGDPALLSEVCAQVKTLMERDEKEVKPIFGICLGHQMMGTAAGASTYKLKYGNRGHNQPVRMEGTQRCYITSQNHGYAVDATKLEGEWEPLWTNENDKTNEGIVHKRLPFFSAQFHPEASAGPEDMFEMFDIFMGLARKTEGGTAKERLVKQMGSSPPLAPEVGVLPKKVLVLGSGGLSIGQAGEFDYSGSQAIKALKEEGIATVLMNPNIATVQTDTGLADRVYYLPVTPEFVEGVIMQERPDAIMLSFGGQTALNCGIELQKQGILERHNVRVLGTPVDVIEATEDREIFEAKLKEIDEKTATSEAAYTVEEAVQCANRIGYPVLVRAAFALGGLGSGFAHNDKELVALVTSAFYNTTQVLIDKSLRGFKEVEYEVVRDYYDNCITVCNMENVDPLGVHTGESIVVAPSQTLSNAEYQILRNVAIKVVRHLGIVGECNIQYALDPDTEEYFIIEVNARLSRSSALASKATGYPLAFVAAKLILGTPLPDLVNTVTGQTTTCFEPSLDYLVVKMPRWDLAKFGRVSREIGSAMKSTGEVMAIGRNFEEALQKAIRMMDGAMNGFDGLTEIMELTDENLSTPTDQRLSVVAMALYKGYTVDRVWELTRIDKWFLHKMAGIIANVHKLETIGAVEKLEPSMLLKSKQLGFSDSQIARLVRTTSSVVRHMRRANDIAPKVKLIDTVAGEFPAVTNYLYLTYNARTHDVDFPGGHVIVMGSGVYRIGSSVEFDWCGVRCARTLRSMGHKVSVINYNPETVSTDYDESDRLFFDELSFETVLEIYNMEKPLGIVLCMGGQLPNNIALKLQRTGEVNILGTPAEMIDGAENRFKFSRMLDSLGVEQPPWKELSSVAAAKDFCVRVGYPCIVRPSYVLSGAAMNVAYSESDLVEYLSEAGSLGEDHPVVVSKMILEAKEIDVDAVANDGETVAIAIMEHVENAGVHSGDATLITPPQDLTAKTIEGLKVITRQIGKALNISGPYNIQFIAKDDMLKVIECNVRVSRSLPFSSKTLGVDMIGLSTRIIMKAPFEIPIIPTRLPFVGVKVAQFSFSRLAGADPTQGVDMHSTGEVACFGPHGHHEEAYLKALLATGFRLPKKNVLLSIGTFKGKQEFAEAARDLVKLGYVLYGSSGTADYYNEIGIVCKAVEWPYEAGGGAVAAEQAKEGAKTSGRTSPSKDQDEQSEEAGIDMSSMADLMANGKIDLVINLPMRNKSHSPASFVTQGYLTRRTAVDFSIPLITDVKCAKLFVTALKSMGIRAIGEGEKRKPIAVQPLIDSHTAHRVVELPGLIDVHVHMREPGHESKEDWGTGTAAALAGGITAVCAMPNTAPGVTDSASLNHVLEIADAKARCDYAVFAAATPENIDSVHGLGNAVAGLVLYIRQDFSKSDDLCLESMTQWRQHFSNWPKSRPVCVQAQSHSAGAAILAAALSDRSIHIMQVSRREEIELIVEAKLRGVKITCACSPHHLFLDANAALGSRGTSCPPLGSADDVAALWENLEHIDVLASAHAPHSAAEKDGESKPPGFPGLETMLPLLLTAVNEGRLTLEELTAKMHHNPRRIFNLPEQPNTYIEVDLDEKWELPADGGDFSQCDWTPFAGRRVQGKVRRVVLRGECAFLDGQCFATAGSGQDLVALNDSTPLLSSGGSVGSRTPRASHRSAFSTFSSAKSSVSAGSHVEMSELALGSSHSQSSDTADNSPEHGPLSEAAPAARQEQGTRLVKSVKGAGGRVSLKHVLSVKQFNKALVHQIMDFAAAMRGAVLRHGAVDLLRGRVLASIFYEPSTRTSCSFMAAMQRLGGTVVPITQVSTSSVAKGETLADFLRTMEAFCDVTVLRHPRAGAVEEGSRSCKKPLINAGDGTGEHPTQALLDAYTIRDELGTLNGITVTFVGDLKNGRTVHSLARLLTLYDVNLVYVSPEELAMPQYIVDEVAGTGAKQKAVRELTDEVVKNTDVLYVTRVQKERFASEEAYDKVKGSYVVSPQTLCAAKKKMVVMHPLPRVDELSPAVDSDPRAAYFRQVTNGMYVRMALLAMVCGKTSL